MPAEQHKCDWSENKAVVYSKFDSISGAIKTQNEDIKCLQLKISDLKVATAGIPDIKKDIESTLSTVNEMKVELNSIKVRSNIVSGLISAVIALSSAIVLWLMK